MAVGAGVADGGCGVDWLRMCGECAGYAEVTRQGSGVEGVQGVVVVGAVDVVADEPAGGAADQNVGGEVLLGEDAADAYVVAKSVDRGAHEPAGILVADDRGHGPGGGGVVGGKGGVERARAEEVALRVVHVWAVAEGDELDGLADGQAVDERFAAKDAGLMGLRGVVVQTPEVHAGGHDAERADSSVRDVLKCC